MAMTWRTAQGAEERCTYAAQTRTSEGNHTFEDTNT